MSEAQTHGIEMRPFSSDMGGKVMCYEPKILSTYLFCV